MSASVSETVRRLSAAAAVAAAVVGAAALPAAAADHPSARPDRDRVVISDVRYDSPGRGERSNRLLNQEWVEVTNNSRHGVNLDGWTLSDSDGHTYTFRHYQLDGHATVRVHTGFGQDSRSDLYQDRRSHVWDREGDTATLRNDHGRFIDAASWGDSRRYDDNRNGHRRYDGNRYDHHRYDRH
ncbi:lamin tail domain-containing protein [Streptomyces sp. NPDC058964]|uniref:lamin tail domain-containing protein n=1 Tax=Streptomyces sp. NPDC058964 TaxID=3346681 RepID=UPI0036CA364E